ncbi:MAG: PEGA domain-containing protein [Bradymonadaceae bacterium]
MRHLCKVGVILAMVLWSTTAVAETVAGLEMDIGSGVDAQLRSEIEAATTTAFKGLSSYSYIEADAARSRMNSVVRGCFTSDCLKEAGASLEARLGLSVKITGEAQIYDWKLELYDLATGASLNTETGTCELCGRAEVVRNYRGSVTTLMSEAKVPALPSGALAQDEGVADTTQPSQPFAGEGVRLRVSVVPAETDVYLNDELVGQGDVTMAVGQGRHEVRFVKEGYRGLKETVVVGDTSPELILLRTHLSQSAAPASGGLPLREAGWIDHLGEHRGVVGWSSVGTGAALLITGSYLNAIHGSHACSTGSFSQCPEVYNTAAPGVIMTITGATLLTGGVVLLIWDHLAGNEAKVRSASVSPAAVPGGSGLILQGRF